METNTYSVTAARGCAAFTGTGSPWTAMSAIGMSHVLMPNPAPAAKALNARFTAFRQIPVMTNQTAALAAVLAPATDIRKQSVHKTRVNAGGDGASGPHPEREPV